MKNKLFAIGINFGIIGSVFAITGCAEYHKRILDNMETKGPEFTRTLANEYEELGKTEQTIMYDESSADYYYLKAIEAKQGYCVQPTQLANWDIDPEKLPELVTARASLMDAIRSGAREAAPKMTAHAQAHFDCWVEQQAENWQLEDIAQCRSEFYNALSKVELILMGGILEVTPRPMVLFDLNSSHLTGEAMRVIDEVVLAAKGASQRILLVGRTDQIGDLKHNKDLSKHRAIMVKNELVRRGIPSSLIFIEAAGETPGPKVDAHNRRVDIIFLKYQ